MRELSFRWVRCAAAPTNLQVNIAGSATDPMGEADGSEYGAVIRELLHFMDQHLVGSRQLPATFALKGVGGYRRAAAMLNPLMETRNRSFKNMSTSFQKIKY